MTTKEIIDHIVANSSMGYIPVDELIEMPVVLSYDEAGNAITEMHTFKVSALSLAREDLTEKRRAAEAIIASL